MKKLLAILAVALVGGVGAYKLFQEEKPRLADTSILAGNMQLENAGQGDVPSAVTPSPAASTASAPISETTRETVLRLSKSKNPEDKFAAYKLIRTCVAARHDELLIADRVAAGGKAPAKAADQVCGDIDAGQIASRHQLLRAATDAGVHGAASRFADEGPTGEGYGADMDVTAADNARFQTDMRQAIETGAAHGDWWSLATLSGADEHSAQSAADYEGALKHLEEANEAYRKENGKDMKSYPENKGRLTYFANKAKTN